MKTKQLSSMTNDEFRDWRARCNLSLTAAARALGISRSMVAAYQAGDHPIPRTVALACWAVGHGAPLKDAED